MSTVKTDLVEALQWHYESRRVAIARRLGVCAYLHTPGREYLWRRALPDGRGVFLRSRPSDGMLGLCLSWSDEQFLPLVEWLYRNHGAAWHAALYWDGHGEPPHATACVTLDRWMHGTDASLQEHTRRLRYELDHELDELEQGGAERHQGGTLPGDG